MTILILGVASASVGLAIGVVFFHAVAIVLASPIVAFLSVALLLHDGFGLVHGMLISVGSLTALQSFYLVGRGYALSTRNDEQDLW
jgi:hypothetical protein